MYNPCMGGAPETAAIDRASSACRGSSAAVAQVRCTLQLEPSTVGGPFQPDGEIPAISVACVNGLGAHVVRGFVDGQRQGFTVTQQLWHMRGAQAPAERGFNSQCTWLCLPIVFTQVPATDKRCIATQQAPMLWVRVYREVHDPMLVPGASGCLCRHCGVPHASPQSLKQAQVQVVLCRWPGQCGDSPGRAAGRRRWQPR